MKTYGQLRYELGRWVIAACEPHVAIRLKHLFPKIPRQSVAPFVLPDTFITAADLDWFCSRYPMSMSDADRRHLQHGRLAFEARQAEMEAILTPDYLPPPMVGLRPGQEIRRYQQQAIEVLRRRRSLMLGDDVGLGKTYTAAGFLCVERSALPAVVVCDAHLQRQWKEKIEAFTTLRVHLITKTKPYNLPPADVYVFRITQVAGWTDIFALNRFKTAIFDEPQNLRTGAATHKGAACKVLAAHTSFRLGLTATPIYNYGAEMWHVMRFLDEDVLGDYGDFAREWCGGDGRIADPKALGTYLREQYALVRRLKSDVGQELPKVSRVVEEIDHDTKAVASIEELAHALAIKATRGTFLERGKAVRELDLLARLTTGVAKAATVAKFVRMIVETGEPVVLWGWHRDVYDIWMRDLADLNPVMYTGSETAKQKDDAKAAFMRGDSNILIMSLRSGAGADGLQHRCSTGVFGELDWSPGIHHQCIGRLDREGQTKPVTAFFLVTDDGSDPPMMEVIGIKASEARQIVDPHLGAQVAEADTSRLQSLVQRYLHRDRQVTLNLGSGG